MSGEPATRPELSFEYFPPRGAEMAERLALAARELAAHQPSFCSVTYGAGGSSREATLETVTRLERDSPFEVAPHLAAIGSTRTELTHELARYAERGVHRIVALRGDRPADYAPPANEAETVPFAADLVRLIRQTHRDRFRIYVACYPECHPEAPDLFADVDRFAEKAGAGADAAITQYFYSAEAYRRFVDEVRGRGLDIPILAGMMPIHDFEQIARFSARCGAEIPRWLATRIRGYRDRSSQREFAADVVASLCERLLADGAPGFHFYTLNRSTPTSAVLRRLGWDRDVVNQ